MPRYSREAATDGVCDASNERTSPALTAYPALQLTRLVPSQRMLVVLSRSRLLERPNHVVLTVFAIVLTASSTGDLVSYPSDINSASMCNQTARLGNR